MRPWPRNLPPGPASESEANFGNGDLSPIAPRWILGSAARLGAAVLAVCKEPAADAPDVGSSAVRRADVTIVRNEPEADSARTTGQLRRQDVFIDACLGIHGPQPIGIRFGRIDPCQILSTDALPHPGEVGRARTAKGAEMKQDLMFIEAEGKLFRGFGGYGRSLPGWPRAQAGSPTRQRTRSRNPGANLSSCEKPNGFFRAAPQRRRQRALRRRPISMGRA
jgi:hypothetical protein